MSSSGQVLIVGSQVLGLVERLEARGYVCTSGRAQSVDDLAKRAKPEVIVLATAARMTSSTLARLRKHPGLRSVPVLVDQRGASSRSMATLEVDGFAQTHDELERLISASIRARRLSERERLVRNRLELLLEVSRSRLPFGELASLVAARLGVALGCEEVSLLVLEGESPRKASVIGGGTRTSVDLAVAPMLRRALEARQPVETEGRWVYPCASGEQGVAAFVLKRSAPFDAEETDFLNAVAVAVSHALEHEQTQVNVQKTRESLEAAYLERYRELGEANRRLNALDRRKNELLAVLSHDLRAPLNVMMGHAWMLLDDSKLSQAHRPSVEAIQRTSKKVLELVETLLEKSRGEDGHIVLFTKTMDVAETCQEAVHELQILAKQKKVALRVEAPMSLMVLGDEQKIRQVLQNLMTNSLKHARGATEIVVQARLKPTPSGPVAFVQVKDDGIITDPNDLLLAFERSTGLGLSICRDFVERHGGEIWAEAPAVGGACFAFTLPLTRASTSVGPVRKTDAPVILLVEDDPVFARVASLGLSGHYRVEVARDGDDGLARARQLRPDAIVMDVFMPNRDGLDTLKALRSSPDTSHIPVVLISANPDLAGTLNTLEGGPVDFLAKPFALKTLLTTVNMVLKRSAVLTASGPGNDRETGLFDHVGVVNRLEQEMSRSVRYARPLTVVVLKPTMPPGDRVKALAGIVRHELRSPDVVGHLGQGVLATILPETPSDMARPLISRLCVLLQDHGVAYRSRLIDVRDDTASAEQILEQLLS